MKICPHRKTHRMDCLYWCGPGWNTRRLHGSLVLRYCSELAFMTTRRRPACAMVVPHPCQPKVVQALLPSMLVFLLPRWYTPAFWCQLCGAALLRPSSENAADLRILECIYQWWSIQSLQGMDGQAIHVPECMYQSTLQLEVRHASQGRGI